MKMEEKDGKPLKKGDAKMEVNAPLKKGDAKMEVDAPLEKGSSSSSKTPLKKGKLMIDYHNTLEIGDKICDANIQAVQELLDMGYEICVCTWCMADTAARVRQHLEQMPWWSKIQFLHTPVRSGKGAKPDLALQHGCQWMFDDAGDILQEALEKGLKVFPIQKKYQYHYWAKREGLPQFAKLVDAVACFHTMEGNK